MATRGSPISQHWWGMGVTRYRPLKPSAPLPSIHFLSLFTIALIVNSGWISLEQGQHKEFFASRCRCGQKVLHVRARLSAVHEPFDLRVPSVIGIRQPSHSSSSVPSNPPIAQQLLDLRHPFQCVCDGINGDPTRETTPAERRRENASQTVQESV